MSRQISRIWGCYPQRVPLLVPANGAVGSENHSEDPVPVESSEDYAEQLLPSLLGLTNLDTGVWARARATFDAALR